MEEESVAFVMKILAGMRKLEATTREE